MTKKHFILLAAAIRTSSLDDAAKLTAARALAVALLDVNPRFDFPRFVTACTG